MVAPDEVIQVIANTLAKIGPATTAIGGRIGFRVHGERGGDWLLDLATAGGAWARPADPRAVETSDCALYAEAEAFALLVTDPAGLEAELKSGTLVVDGDRARFVRLGHMLAQSGGILDQRAGNGASTKKISTPSRRRKPCL